jgi:hypothetical protein
VLPPEYAFPQPPDALYAPPSESQLASIASYGRSPHNPYDSADFAPHFTSLTTRQRGGRGQQHAQRYEGFDPLPLQWDPRLAQWSSRQFRPRPGVGASMAGVVDPRPPKAQEFVEFLHPPIKSARRVPVPPAAPALALGSSSTVAAAAAATGGGGVGVSSPASLNASLTTARSTSSAAGMVNIPVRVSAVRYHRPRKLPLPVLNGPTWQRYLAHTQPLLSGCVAGHRASKMAIWREQLLQRKINPHTETPHA